MHKMATIVVSHRGQNLLKYFRLITASSGNRYSHGHYGVLSYKQNRVFMNKRLTCQTSSTFSNLLCQTQRRDISYDDQLCVNHWSVFRLTSLPFPTQKSIFFHSFR